MKCTKKSLSVVFVLLCLTSIQLSLFGMLPIQFHRVNMDAMQAPSVRESLKGTQATGSSAMTKNLQLRSFGRSYVAAVYSWFYKKQPTVSTSRKLYREDFSELGVRYLDHVERLKTSPKCDCESFFEIVAAKLHQAQTAARNLIYPDDKNSEPLSEFDQFTRLLESGYHVPVYLKHVNDTVGYGVFADKEIKEGEFVGEYTGQEVIYDPNKGTPAEVAYMWLTPDKGIDAKYAGNFTRFVNQSFNPNVEGHYVYHNNGYHMVYVAKRTIKDDEQLLVDYGAGYWLTQNITPAPLDSWPHRLKSYWELFKFRLRYDMH